MSRRMSEGQQTINDLVISIHALARGDLIVQWEVYFGTLPHKLISTRLLVMAVAYAMQVEQYGGLSNRSRKKLLRLGSASVDQAVVMSPAGTQSPAWAKPRSGFIPRPRSGTRYVREWNGKSHVVEVTDKGFAWQGQTYRSLSAIATTITGTRWSGPRFFGQVSS